jgi:hypothetical protein
MLMDSIRYISGADWNYDIAGSTLSPPSDGDVITRFTATRKFRLPANFAGVVFNLGTNPTSTAQIAIKKNGTTIGAIAINTSGVETLPTVPATDFEIDDRLEIEVVTAAGMGQVGITIKTLALQ